MAALVAVGSRDTSNSSRLVVTYVAHCIVVGSAYDQQSSHHRILVDLTPLVLYLTVVLLGMAV